jgi:hypothetical protein
MLVISNHLNVSMARQRLLTISLDRNKGLRRPSRSLAANRFGVTTGDPVLGILHLNMGWSIESVDGFGWFILKPIMKKYRFLMSILYENHGEWISKYRELWTTSIWWQRLRPMASRKQNTVVVAIDWTIKQNNEVQIGDLSSFLYYSGFISLSINLLLP